MKIAVINFSGNVGKSMIARHCLAPRMNNAQIISVESVNSDGTEGDAIRGKQFCDLIEAMALMEEVVIDVGASNVEDFINRMSQYRGSHEDFDYFVVPTIGKQKQQRDTVSTINALAELGIPAKKIRVVFNMLENDDNPERIFSGIFEYATSEEKFILRPDAIIHTNEIYGKIRGSEQTIASILHDPNDLKEQLKASKESDEKLRISKQIGIKRLAAGVTEELDAVFKTLFR
jgi:hypothetical protein